MANLGQVVVSAAIIRNAEMTRSELVEKITKRFELLSSKDIELAVRVILEHMSSSLAQGGRIEIRGFGSFSLHYRAPRKAHNPKTGEALDLNYKYVPHFKPGKKLRERVNENFSWLQKDHSS